jgi:hypothetical protein
MGVCVYDPCQSLYLEKQQQPPHQPHQSPHTKQPHNTHIVTPPLPAEAVDTIVNATPSPSCLATPIAAATHASGASAALATAAFSVGASTTPGTTQQLGAATEAATSPLATAAATSLPRQPCGGGGGGGLVGEPAAVQKRREEKGPRGSVGHSPLQCKL